MPVIVISSDFLDSYARVPRAQQRKVRNFLDKFQENPTSSAINYEKIHSAKDDKVRTVRIGNDYRAIVIHPPKGDVYMLAWVDHHDEAMQWAQDKTFAINPSTGALQIYSVEQVQNVIEQTAPLAVTPKSPKLLDGFQDELLCSFGVPSVLLPAIRAVQNEEQFTELSKHLPAECAEALIWLREGMPTEEIREAVSAPRAKLIDTNDFTAAIENPNSKRRFVRIESDHDLQAMLNAPLERWRVFLHPEQHSLVVRDFKAPACVLGGAGTGKTVVAMHRARYLAASVFTGSDDRVLFTTFTTNLARDIDSQLNSFCGEERKRIEVVNLDAWASQFLAGHGRLRKIATDEELDKAWASAASAVSPGELPLGFIRQEWDRVVRANEIETLDDYLSVSRMGRGRILSRPQRVLLWKIFEGFRTALKALGKSEWLDIITEARQLLNEKKLKLSYRAIIVDEVQDMHVEKLRLIRSMIPEGKNDLFLAGDPHQRIYGAKFSLSQSGIKVRGRSKRLKINYRTTEQIRSWATRVLTGVAFDDLDGGKSAENGYRSILTGPEPEVNIFSSLKQEQLFLHDTVEETLRSRSADEICIVARTGKVLRHYYDYLVGSGVSCAMLEKSGDVPKDAVRMATMHRVKGLEFTLMIIVGVAEGNVPWNVQQIGDPVTAAEHDQQERSLLFVAATRARDRLVISASGNPSPYLTATNLSKSAEGK